MSIEKLDIMLGEEDIMRQINPQIYKVFIEIYNTFKDLQQQLTQKEDAITLSEIKEARNINGS